MSLASPKRPGAGPPGRGLLRALPIACVAVLAAPGAAAAQALTAPPALQDDAGFSKALPRIAEDALAAYRNDDRRTFLEARFKLQALAGHEAEALDTLAQLQALDAAPGSVRARAGDVEDAIYLQARAGHGGAADLPAAYRSAFRNRVPGLDDLTAVRLLNDLGFADTVSAASLAQDRKALAGKWFEDSFIDLPTAG